MGNALIIGVASGIGVIVICLIILAGYFCYRKFQEPKPEPAKVGSVEEGKDNVSIHSPDIIMTKHDRTEDLFTGKRMPFGVHSSMTNIPEAIEKEGEDNANNSTVQSNGINRQSRYLSVRSTNSVNSAHSFYSVSSNAPTFSDHAGNGATSIHY